MSDDFDPLDAGDPRGDSERSATIGGEGELTIYAADEQNIEPVDLEKYSELARAVLVSCGARGNAELSLLFVDEATIAQLNEQFMGHEGPTDVLSFPIDGEDVDDPNFSSATTGPDRPSSDPDDLPLLLGDVIICPSVARRNVEGGDRTWHAGTYDDELALLTVHGILHVMGMDHDNPHDEAIMRSRTTDLLALHYGPGASESARPDELIELP